MAIAFVDCGDEHLKKLRAFWAQVYRPDYIFLRDPRLFEWQFGNGQGGYNIKLALLEGSLAGCLGYLPVTLELAGQDVPAAWVVNWMVQPDYRRLGLGPFLMRKVMDQFSVTLNIGPNQDAAGALLKMGWVDFGFLERYVAVLDIKQTAALTGAELEWPQSTESAAAEVMPGPSASVKRTHHYLRRRYEEHPSFTYQTLTEAGATAIYRIEQVKDSPSKVGRIVEIIRQNEPVKPLLKALLDHARSHGVCLLDFFCSSNALEKELEVMGFVRGTHPAAAQIPLLFQPVDRRRSGIRFMAFSREPEVLKAQQWWVTKGDGDQDRPN